MTTPWTGEAGTLFGDGPVSEKLREEYMRRKALAIPEHPDDPVVLLPASVMRWKNRESWPRCEAIVIEAGTAIGRYGRPDGKVGHVECMDPAACAVIEDGAARWMCWPHLVERAIYHKHRVFEAIAPRSARCEACATPAKHLRTWGFACDWHNVEPKPQTYRWGVAIGRCCAKDKLADGDCEVHKRQQGGGPRNPPGARGAKPEAEAPPTRGPERGQDGGLAPATSEASPVAVREREGAGSGTHNPSDSGPAPADDPFAGVREPHL